MADDVRDVSVFAWNFRGFKKIKVPLNGTIFLVGDNSSGKSSILHLVSCVFARDLDELPALNENLSVGRYDYFSSYLDNADVTFGYECFRGDQRIVRLVTVQRVPKGIPKVTRCSHMVGRSLATIQSYGSGLRKRLIEQSGEETVEELYETHLLGKGFKKNDKDTKKYLAPNSPMALINAFDETVIEEHNLFDVFVSSLPEVRHIAPVRGLPERFYDFKRTLSSSGKHFAVMWRDLQTKRWEPYFDIIRKFGRESGLFEDVRVEPVSRRVDEAPLIVTIKKQSKEFFLNQVGVGLSQVVPVLVETLLPLVTDRTQILQLQQPELHLHPVAQAALGTFFYEILGVSKQPTLIETHSNYLIDRYRSEIRDDMAPSTPTQVIFCKNTKSGNEMTLFDVDSDGRFVEPPDEYFSFFLSELTRTMI